MNYLKTCADKILIAKNGYKTPQKVLDKIDLIQKPQWQNTNTK
jgi:hypothetical protein